MGWSIKELCTKLSLKDLMEWIAYYEVEPWGGNVDGIRAASNTAAVYNAGLMQADPKRLRSNPFTAEQFYVGVKSNSKTKKVLRDWENKKNSFSKVFGKAKKI